MKAYDFKVKVGDLVRSNGYLAIVICVNAHETLIKWLDDGIVEDADNYTTGLEVISESKKETKGVSYG